MATGQLRVYFGAAPGVGKTFKMLEEGHRRLERGTDVVIGFVETHGRAHTADLLKGLEVIPRTTVTYRGAALEEMDLAAVLARPPQVALVDELAHTNAPGSPHAKRWQDIEKLLDAGITVITTVNLQHLESLNDVVYEITGVRQRETVPTRSYAKRSRSSWSIWLPRRCGGGWRTATSMRRRRSTQPSATISASESTALRELALLWVAGKVDEQLDQYRADHNIGSHWETRERVVVALTGGAEGETLIRRAARIAARTRAQTCSQYASPAVTVSQVEIRLIWHVSVFWWRTSAALSPGGRDRHPGRPAGLCARRQRHAVGAWREPSGALGAVVLPGRRRYDNIRVRIDRRTSGHA